MADQDNIDTNLAELAEETAEEVAMNTEDLSESNKQVVNTDDDPCNSYEWSIIFILVFVAAFVVMIVHLVTLFKRRSNLSCFDILTMGLFVSIMIQFGPMLSQVLHSGHSVYHFSQSGCKLLFFTDYGMRHVITFLVSSLFVYSYLILFHSFDTESLDRRMRNNVAWLILLLFAIEGLFGITAAVYVDMGYVGPQKIPSCVWSPTMSLTASHIVALEITLRPITPYLLPLLLLAFPMFQVTQAIQNMGESKTKSTLHSCVLLVWSYFIMNAPYATLLVVESVAHMYWNDTYSWRTSCNFKWAFFLLHQSWFLLMPISVVVREVEQGNKPIGSDLAIATWNTAKRQVNGSKILA